MPSGTRDTEPTRYKKTGGLLGVRVGEASHPGPAGSRRTRRVKEQKCEKVEPLLGLLLQLTQLLTQVLGGAQGLGHLEPVLQSAAEMLGTQLVTSVPKPKKQKKEKRSGEVANNAAGVGTQRVIKVTNTAQNQPGGKGLTAEPAGKGQGKGKTKAAATASVTPVQQLPGKTGMPTR